MKKFVLPVLFIYLLLAPIIAILCGNNGGAGILAGVGLTAIILTRLPDLREFSGLGIVAKLEGKIQEADEIIKKLKAISAALTRSSLQQISMSGQMFSSLPISEKFKVRDEIVEALKGMGISDDEILNVQEVWISVYGNLLLNRILNVAGTLPSSPVPKAIISNLPRIAKYDLPNPESLTKSLPMNNDKLTTMLQEYRLLITTGKMNEPDIIPFSAGLSFAWKEQAPA